MPKVNKFLCVFALAASVCFSGNIYAADNQMNKSVAVDQQQKKTVTGTITDNLGPVAGASIAVKGTTIGTISNFDGEFSIEVNEGQTLVISFIGYITQEIVISGQRTLNIALKEDSQALGEVVVTALGIKRDAKKLGYAVSTVGSEELVKTASPTLGSALYGKAAGVRVQTAPGGATGAISINVRGLSSITGTNQPLIIMDGVPIRNGDANKDGYWTDQRVNSNGLADINPEDIETLSILKGASASALYGSEAANGVVMITTKSGKGAQGFGVDVSASLVGDWVAYMPEYQTKYGIGLTTAQRLPNGSTSDGFYQRTDRNGNSHRGMFASYYYWGAPYDGQDVLYYDGTVRKYSVINDNPWNEIFRTGVSQQYNISMTNASEKNNVRLSYTYIDNMPNQYNSSFNKHTFALNGSYKITDKIKVDYNANYMMQDLKNRPYRISRLVTNFTGMAGPLDDVKYLKDNTITSLGYLNQVYTASNHATPNEGFEYNFGTRNLVDEYFWHILAKERLENNNRLIAGISPSWEIIDGLTLRGKIATDYTTEKQESKENTTQSNAFGSFSGFYELVNRRYQTIFGDIMLTYDKNLTDKIGLNAMAGWTGRNESTYVSTVGTSGGLTVENWFHLNASKDKANASMNKIEFLKTAFLGTASLSYDSWAYLEGTIRHEKVSTLAKGSNSFTYPSVNASVIYTELMKDKRPSWYDYGKIRMSYGVVGNAPEVYKANVAYTQNSASGYTYNSMDMSLGNELIEPETKYEWELGVESKFFGNRLGFELSYYTNRIEDQILNTTMPASSGGTKIWMNIGELKNKGLEFAVYGTPVQTRDWQWDIRANVAWNKNEVTKLADGIDELEHSNWDNGSMYLKSTVGRPMGDFYSYVPAKDENGNYIVNAQGEYKLDPEMQRVGNALPKVQGGIATTVSYKNFFADVSLDYRIGGAVFNQPYQYYMLAGAIKETLKYHDGEGYGATYYLNADNVAVPYSGSTGPNGEQVYDNGIILPGVKEDGTPNDVMIPADYNIYRTYGWGGNSASGVRHYSNSVFDNTYLKVREISIGYSFPKSIVSKFHCKNLQLSVFGRNLFYIYKNLPCFDAEATDGTTWITQAAIGGSTATTRSFGVSLRASF